MTHAAPFTGSIGLDQRIKGLLIDSIDEGTSRLGEDRVVLPYEDIGSSPRFPVKGAT